MAANILFYFFSLTALLSAIYVVLTKHPTYGVLSLVVTMFSLAALFVMLHAHFVAMIQILIYAGAILILFLFILMLLGTEGSTNEQTGKHSRLWRIISIFLAVAFLAQFFIILQVAGNWSGEPASIIGSVEAIGRSMFTQHLLAFELVSLILLVGVIGVVNLSRKEDASDA